MSEVRMDVKPVRGDSSRVIATVNNCNFETLTEIGLVLQRLGHAASFLGPKGWQAAEHTFVIPTAERENSSVVFQLGPDVVSHMSTGSYTISLHEKGGASDVKGVLVWSRSIPKYRPKQGSLGSLEESKKSSQAKETTVQPTGSTSAIDEEEQSTAVPVDSIPDGTEGGKSSAGIFIIAGMVVLLLAGAAGAAYYLDLFDKILGEQVASSDQQEEQAEQPSEQEPAPSSLSLNDRLSNFIASNPTIDDILAQADKYIQQREFGAAMSLFRRAGGMGSAEAYTRLARLYDPSTPAVSGGPAQQGNKAYSFYLKAINLNSADAKKSAKKLKKWAENQASIGNEQAQRLLQFIELNDRGEN